MNENEPVAKKNPNTSAPRGGPREKNIARTFDERFRAVTLHLQEGFSRQLIAQEMGVSVGAVDRWVQLYRLHGQEGLKSKPRGGGGPQVPLAVRDKIIQLKQEDPARGIKRISQLLKKVSVLNGP